jgi:hypothetical protein
LGDLPLLLLAPRYAGRLDQALQERLVQSHERPFLYAPDTMRSSLEDQGSLSHNPPRIMRRSLRGLYESDEPYPLARMIELLRTL